MKETTNWEQKNVAFLHDPPHKVLDIQKHKDEAESLFPIALGREPTEDERKLVKRADRLSAAADRLTVERRHIANFSANPSITHMLSGRRVVVPGIEHTDWDAPSQAVRELVKGESKARRRYLRLWRLLNESLAKIDAGGLGKMWAMLPATSRLPDHSLIDHLSTAASFATALPRPALLVLSVGPIQAFIASARRTQDLWMGSYLLSYLTWRGIQAVAARVGPDAILYPALRGHPLADLWLKEEQVPLPTPSPAMLQQASLPNTFTALLPADVAKELGETAEEAIRQGWADIAQAVYDNIPGTLPNDVWRDIWKRQIDNWPQVYWSIFKWPQVPPSREEAADAIKKPRQPKGLVPSADAGHAWLIRQTYQKLVKPADGTTEDWLVDFEKRFNLYWGEDEKVTESRRHQMNAGTMYVLLHDLAKRGLAVRKTTRDFGPAEEDGEKCTVCGERSALRLSDTPRQAVHDYWANVAQALQQQNRYAEIRPDGKERLCAICAIKRFVQRSYFENEIGLTGTFPSTRHVAAAAFWQAVLGLDNSELWLALTKLSNALYAAGIPRTATENAIPFLQVRANQLTDQAQRKTALQLLLYDAELLTPDAFTDTASFNEEWRTALKDSDIEQLRTLAADVIKTAREAGVPPPARYYAALMFDGDHMGKWLSGALGPKLGDVLHPDIRQQLETDDDWKEVLEQKRMVSPAHHTAISSALATFARRIVRMVIEEWHPGRLVYAGGDDVLALLPVSDALTATRELRFLFSGEVKRIGERPNLHEVPDTYRRASGFIELDGEWLTTMGPEATASAGIAIAHYKSPLGDTLNAMRAAEKDAKNHYGRNALAVRFLKRSGEARHVGTKWGYGDKGQADPVALLAEVQSLFAEPDPKKPHLSGKLPYALHAEARVLSNLPCDAIQSEIGRLLKRQGELKDKTRREALAENLARWAVAMNGHSRRAGGVTMLADWLVLARFLATGGGEE